MSAWKRPDPTPLPRHFYSARCCTLAGKKIAAASFRGEAATTHRLVHVFVAIEEAVTELLESESPDGLIFDFRELKYEWGDQMDRTLTAPSRWFGGDFPVVIITSELNRAGLTSLVRDEMQKQPADWLCDSEESAARLMESKLGRKND